MSLTCLSLWFSDYLEGRLGGCGGAMGIGPLTDLWRNSCSSPGFSAVASSSTSSARTSGLSVFISSRIWLTNWLTDSEVLSIVMTSCLARDSPSLYIPYLSASSKSSSKKSGGEETKNFERLKNDRLCLQSQVWLYRERNVGVVEEEGVVRWQRRLGDAGGTALPERGGLDILYLSGLSDCRAWSLRRSSNNANLWSKFPFFIHGLLLTLWKTLNTSSGWILTSPWKLRGGEKGSYKPTWVSCRACCSTSYSNKPS